MPIAPKTVLGKIPKNAKSYPYKKSTANTSHMRNTKRMGIRALPISVRPLNGIKIVKPPAL